MLSEKQKVIIREAGKMLEKECSRHKFCTNCPSEISNICNQLEDMNMAELGCYLKDL